MSMNLFVEVPQSIQSLTKMIGQLNDRIQWLEKQTEEFITAKTIIGKRGKNRYPVKTNSIAYCFTENRDTWLLTTDGKEFLAPYNMDQLEQLLGKSNFFRTNRQTICAKNAVEKFEILPKSRIKVILNPIPDFEIIISSEKSAPFKNWISC